MCVCVCAGATETIREAPWCEISVHAIKTKQQNKTASARGIKAELVVAYELLFDFYYRQEVVEVVP